MPCGQPSHNAPLYNIPFHAKYDYNVCSCYAGGLRAEAEAVDAVADADAVAAAGNADDADAVVVLLSLALLALELPPGWSSLAMTSHMAFAARASASELSTSRPCGAILCMRSTTAACCEGTGNWITLVYAPHPTQRHLLVRQPPPKWYLRVAVASSSMLLVQRQQALGDDFYLVSPRQPWMTTSVSRERSVVESRPC